MITLYTWTTPNGRKISIALEEMGLAYEVKPINIGKDEQFSADFLRVAPNNKIPAIVDHDAPGGPLSVFESGAILQYLADKTGKFLPRDYPARAKVLEWLNWQMGGLGPMLGQLNYFANRAPEKMPLAIDRFRDESVRLMQVMEKQLAKNAFLAGAEYSIADMACYAWTLAVLPNLKKLAGDKLGSTTAIDLWLMTVGGRDAVKRGMAVPHV